MIALFWSVAQQIRTLIPLVQPRLMGQVAAPLAELEQVAAARHEKFDQSAQWLLLGQLFSGFL